MSEQIIYAVAFMIHPVNRMPWLNHPTTLEVWEAGYLTGIFHVTEAGNVCCLDGTRFARIVDVDKQKTEYGFRVKIEFLTHKFNPKWQVK